jgi:hypothetical protein
MAKRQIIYFYEYSGEIRGNCVGHAKLMADMENIHISLAFSLPMWEKQSARFILHLKAGWESLKY